jgi:hypothetical protein
MAMATVGWACTLKGGLLASALHWFSTCNVAWFSRMPPTRWLQPSLTGGGTHFGRFLQASLCPPPTPNLPHCQCASTSRLRQPDNSGTFCAPPPLVLLLPGTVQESTRPSPLARQPVVGAPAPGSYVAALQQAAGAGDVPALAAQFTSSCVLTPFWEEVRRPGAAC